MLFQILTSALLLPLSVTSMLIAPILADLISALARLDFLVTEKPAMVRENFYYLSQQNLGAGDGGWGGGGRRGWWITIFVYFSQIIKLVAKNEDYINSYNKF